MKIRILSADDVHALLPMHKCLEVMTETLKTLGRGKGVNPLRSLVRFPDGNGILGMMPAYLGSPKCAGIKVVTVMPGNHGTPYDSHQGMVMVFEVEHGCLRALVEASAITAIRTAAVSAVATRLLARENAKKLTLLGSGVQAATHLEAMLAVRKISRVTVWSPTEKHAEKFATRESARYKIPITVAKNAQSATEDADIICTVTSAREPVLRGAWLAPGVHVNAVGACLPVCRELDSAAVAVARLFVDRKESTLKESGDFLIPQKEGAIDESHILGEIGDILLGKIPQRESDDEITLFKSLGLAVEDLAAAYHVYDKAVQTGVGAEVGIGGPKV